MDISSLELQKRAISRVLAAIEAIKRGEMVVMVDDEDRENEGDLVFAADLVSTEKINFMAAKARGLICLTLDADFVDRLELPLMTDRSKTKGVSMGTAFTVSIEAREGVTTGISAADRAQTIRVAVNPNSKPTDLVVPGHIFPLRAQVGGVLMRAGHTEGSVDLARMAGLSPAGVICEIMNQDGSMARRPDLEKFAKDHGLCFVTIEDLITFRLMRESLIELVSEGPIETEWGIFQASLFKSQIDGTYHMAVRSHDFSTAEVIDVRVQRQDRLADVFGSVAGGGRQRIAYGMKLLQEQKNAVFLYLSHNENADKTFPESFANLLIFEKEKKTPDLDKRSQVQPMDPRQVGVGAQILKTMGVERMRLHLSRPAPLKGLGGFGLEVVDVKIMPLN